MTKKVCPSTAPPKLYESFCQIPLVAYQHYYTVGSEVLYASPDFILSWNSAQLARGVYKQDHTIFFEWVKSPSDYYVWIHTSQSSERQTEILCSDSAKQSSQALLLHALLYRFVKECFLPLSSSPT